MKVKNPKKIEIERNKILDAAIQCFIEKGYAATSVDDIVMAYGKSKGSIYYYFKSKEQIFKALFIRQYKYENEALEKINVSTNNIQDFVTNAINGAYGFIQEHYDFITVSIECWSISLHDKELTEILKKKQERIKKFFKPIKKYFKNKNDFENFFALYMTILDGLLIRSLLKKQKFEKISKQIIKEALFGFLQRKKII